MEIQKVPHKLVTQGEAKKEEAASQCAICKSNGHETWECPKFQAEIAKGRTDLLRASKPCYKCFRKHGIGKCTKDNCPKCKGTHHLLICYQRENEVRKPTKGTTSAITKGKWDTQTIVNFYDPLIRN